MQVATPVSLEHEQLFCEVWRQLNPEQHGLSAGCVLPQVTPDPEQCEVAPARSAVKLIITGAVQLRMAAFLMNLRLSMVLSFMVPLVGWFIVPPSMSVRSLFQANTVFQVLTRPFANQALFKPPTRS